MSQALTASACSVTRRRRRPTPAASPSISATDAFDEFGIYTASVFLEVRLTTAGRLRSLGFALVPTLFPMALWDLWLDYHRRDADGLTHGNVRNARPGVTLTAGAHIVVGNEEADPAVAEVVRIALSSRS